MNVCIFKKDQVVNLKLQISKLSNPEILVTTKKFTKQKLFKMKILKHKNKEHNLKPHDSVPNRNFSDVVWKTVYTL